MRWPLSPLLAAFMLAGCASTPAPSPASSEPPAARGFGARLHASGIPVPTDADELSDGSLLVAARDGRIFRVADDGAIAVVADLSGAVLDGGERGLLGIAVADPDETGRAPVYLAYIRRSDGAMVLVAATIDPVSYRIDGISAPLLAIDRVYENHNGGDIEVLADGRLIVSTGDSGGSGDPLDASQDLSSRLGKLLLIDPSASPPTVTTIARGLRNPWRIALDADRTTLWIADVGQNRFEEIDRLPLDDVATAGADPVNFGWPILEGDACFRTSPCQPPSNYVAPIATYEHGPGCSVIGGAVAHGRYFFSDYCDARIYALPIDALSGGKPVEVLSLQGGRRLSAIVAPSGNRIWLLDTERGEVLELVPTP